MSYRPSRKHYFGLTWDEAGEKRSVEFQATKSVCLVVVSRLEAITGKRAVDLDAMKIKN